MSRNGNSQKGTTTSSSRESKAYDSAICAFQEDQYSEIVAHDGELRQELHVARQRADELSEELQELRSELNRTILEFDQKQKDQRIEYDHFREQQEKAKRDLHSQCEEVIFKIKFSNFFKFTRMLEERNEQLRQLQANTAEHSTVALETKNQVAYY